MKVFVVKLEGVIGNMKDPVMKMVERMSMTYSNTIEQTLENAVHYNHVSGVCLCRRIKEVRFVHCLKQ